MSREETFFDKLAGFCPEPVPPKSDDEVFELEKDTELETPANSTSNEELLDRIAKLEKLLASREVNENGDNL